MSTAARTGRSRRRGARSAPVLYDFSRPIQLSREHSKLLQQAFETFAAQASTVFTSVMRAICEVSLVSVDQRPYADYVESLGHINYLLVFDTGLPACHGVLQYDVSTVMRHIDRMLGGPGAAEQPERPLTEIEQNVARTIDDQLLSELRHALADVMAVEPTVDHIEFTPALLQLAGPADAVVVVSLTITHDESEVPMSFCLPFDAIHPYLVSAVAPASMSAEERARRQRASAQLQQSFREVPVDVAVRFRTAGLSPEELVSMSPGDVIRLPHPSGAPLDLIAGERVFARATAGVQGPRLAALIIESATEENS